MNKSYIQKDAAIDVLEHYHELVELGIENAYKRSKEELLNLSSIDINNSKEKIKNEDDISKYLAQGHECCGGCLND